MTRRIVTTNGYITIFRPGHPLAMRNGYVYEHRIIAEQKIGRALRPGEQIHHVDGNKQNNRPENLEVVTDLEHHLRHRKLVAGRRLPGEANRIIFCECGCGAQILKFDLWRRPRSFVSGHNKNISNTPKKGRHAK